MARYKKWLGRIVRMFFSAMFVLLVLFMLVQRVDQRSYVGASTHRLLVASKSTESMELHGKGINGTVNFDESMHEVPRGANPDSNR